MSKQLKKQLKKKVSVKDTEKIEIPKYVLEGDKNIPEDLKKVIDYFRDCGNQKFAVCLVGKRESIENDLKEKVVQYPFIHLTEKNLKDIYSFLPVSVKKSIRYINKLVSNPQNSFNQNPLLGVHNLGLVFSDEIPKLNEFGYGLPSWNGIQIYCDALKDCKCWNKLNPDSKKDCN